MSSALGQAPTEAGRGCSGCCEHAAITGVHCPTPLGHSQLRSRALVASLSFTHVDICQWCLNSVFKTTATGKADFALYVLSQVLAKTNLCGMQSWVSFMHAGCYFQIMCGFLVHVVMSPVARLACTFCAFRPCLDKCVFRFTVWSIYVDNSCCWMSLQTPSSCSVSRAYAVYPYTGAVCIYEQGTVL